MRIIAWKPFGDFVAILQVLIGDAMCVRRVGCSSCMCVLTLQCTSQRVFTLCQPLSHLHALSLLKTFLYFTISYMCVSTHVHELSSAYLYLISCFCILSFLCIMSVIISQSASLHMGELYNAIKPSADDCLLAVL